MGTVADYNGYIIIGLAIELQPYLDPVIYDRLIHEGPQSNEEANRIIDMLNDLKKKVSS